MADPRTSRPANRLGRRGFLAALGAGSAVPLLGSSATAVPASASAAPGSGSRYQVIPGADDLASRNFDDLAGQRVGVITNPTGILRDLRHEVDVMAESDAVNLVGVFGPEHGFRGTAQAGESEDTYVDERTGVTVYDAYGADADAFADMFTEAGVETVVFDIQDVGSRFYTYIWTMYTAMLAAVDTGVRFVVLDRPNPTGGTARGPMMTPEYTSGVGLKEIVQQHGMTVGELARFFDGEFLEDEAGARLPDLHIVQVRRWRRDIPFADSGLPWVPPSPNMPTVDTALVYPGTCLFEGTLWSEGRGTTRPFEYIGAPEVPYDYAAAVADYDLPGVGVREGYFVPTFSKHVDETCGGVQLHVSDPNALDPVELGVAMLVEARRHHPDFEWRVDEWDDRLWIDKLTGSPRVREMVDDGAELGDITAVWTDELADFDQRRQQYLLYRGPGRD